MKKEENCEFIEVEKGALLCSYSSEFNTNSGDYDDDNMIAIETCLSIIFT
jgi:hypothetical protein